MSRLAIARSTAVVLLAVLAIWFAQQPPPDTPAPPVASVGPPPATPASPVTEDEAREFARKVEEAVVAGDAAALTRLYRLSELVGRCVSDLNMTAEVRRELLAGAPFAGGELLAGLSDTVHKGGRFTLLRIRTVDGRPRVIMRLIHPRGAVNYHDIVLARYPDGEVGAEDIHVVSTGEPLSVTFRRLILQDLAAQDRGILAQLTGIDQVYTRHIPQINTFMDQVRTQPAEALATFRQLPDELQKDKSLQLLALHAGVTAGGDEYLRELERFRQNHPNDPAIDLILIDYYSTKGDYDAALKGLDRLDQIVGGDPYLGAMRGVALTWMGRYAEAKAQCEKAITAEPKLGIAYFARVGVALKEGDYEDALNWLKAEVDACGPELDPDLLEKHEAYAGFVKSPQFAELKQWLAARK